MKKLYIKSWFYPIIPLVLWAAFSLLPFLFQNEEISAMHQQFIYGIFYKNLLILVAFYVHAYLLYPLLKNKSSILGYIIGLVLCLVVFVTISKSLMPKMNNFDLALKKIESKSALEMQKMLPKPPKPNIISHIPPFLIAIFGSYFYCVLLGVNKRENDLSERENEQLKTELNFLRSQISPHFMFNVLNSMVSLARKKSALLEPSLINMSNLMRYMLYERNENHISLKTEVEYLKNYIDLQLLRYGDTVKLNMYISGKFESYSIEPMLLIPFVENAFKHGLSMVEKPLIDIFLTLNSTNNTLQFMVLNNISPVEDMKENDTGIGMQNIKRRLELLYPGRHHLTITQRDDVYKADLMIKML